VNLPMVAPEESALRVFCLNVGTGDATVVFAPPNHVCVVDVCDGRKVAALLRALGLGDPPTIDNLIITHPHVDHYGGVDSLFTGGLAKVRKVQEGTQICGKDETLKRFLEPATRASRYATRLKAMRTAGVEFPGVSGGFQLDEGVDADSCPVMVEPLMPPDGLLREALEHGLLEVNHFSIMVRVTIQGTGFSMLIAADAQFENWAPYDHEAGSFHCHVLRAAHHGSKHGTQYERLARLRPQWVIVSADPTRLRPALPDAVGAVILDEYRRKAGRPDSRPSVLLAADRRPFGGVGSVEVRVAGSGEFELHGYGDDRRKEVDLRRAKRLGGGDSADWPAIYRARCVSA
jgi:competence protein ComEC